MMGPRFMAWILLASSILTPLGGKAHRKTEEGNRHYAAGELEEALAAYTEAQVVAPEAAELHYNLGNVLYREGDFEGAADAFTRALLSGSTDLAPRAAYNLGNARFRQQEYQPAIDAYRRALEARPDDRDAKRNLELALRAREEQQQQDQQQDQQKQDPQDSPEEKESPQPSEGGDQGDEGEQAGDPGQDRQQDGSNQSGSENESKSAPSPEEMTAAQAERLLDSLSEEERKSLRMEALQRLSDGSSSKEKDW